MGKYIGRWQHPVTLAVRVWPCSDGARRLTCEKTRIPILGISMEKDGRVLAYHEPRGLRRGYKRGVAFELPVESVDAIAAVEACGGRMDVKGMYVKAPGSSLSQFKQESWLEIPVVANADAKRRRAKEGESLAAQVLRRPKPRAIYGESPEAGLAAKGVEYGKLVFVPDEASFDRDLFLKEIVENDAVIVFGMRGVRKHLVRDLMARSAYWTYPDAKPDEPGGILCGYQVHDRIFRWHPVYSPETARAKHERGLRLAHVNTAEKGAAARRTAFVEGVVNGFAEKLGVSRQRVTSKFLDDGIVEWLARSIDAMPQIRPRAAKELVAPRIKEAVETVAMFYKGIGELNGGSRKRETGGGDV